ncbi:MULTISPECIES: NucA/NucB deoxyribonuclease domain-containing protein [Paenibacillus]|uniref:DNA-entry nuclease n=1 Tax=Paenibacillus odorifer TaxID=189426 RepID=A0A1R0X267_9BACL|nr:MULTISPECIES: NucA/NucB deoxyribonuclease domain-containing protein [Paenibacillus]AIQ75898.1 DNA-entry nuclease [Paenibacillus odorifer]MEC0131275.1 NucA/NucB deoxyribonuclease domain-containing protein [Paenibacillus odorifer]MEC0222086.1 NucA/NucB deoxyribonuclease domain-containing protein [Paenibacillus odorifer]OMC96478.1 DNA-entry nuclease [Paenibacillus odorifer]OMD17609.1 DNA-entry nuclease [Paenibacillus odorifer]
MKKWISSLIIVALLALASYWFEQNGEPTDPSSPSNSSVVQLTFPSDRYPETAKHIQDAIAKGESATCTINREQAEENRKESLKGIPTKKGYDRDEWPMAMCEEGGVGADIEYITPSDNRGAGSWVGNQLEDYADGTRVEFMFK